MERGHSFAVMILHWIRPAGSSTSMDCVSRRVHTLNGTCSGHSSNCSRCSHSAELSLLPLSYKEMERALQCGGGGGHCTMQKKWQYMCRVVDAAPLLTCAAVRQPIGGSDAPCWATPHCCCTGWKPAAPADPRLLRLAKNALGMHPVSLREGECCLQCSIPLGLGLLCMFMHT